MEKKCSSAERERLLRVLSAATFIIFFQAYMVAPIISALANLFGKSVQQVGLIVPAYLIPCGVATLIPASLFTVELFQCPSKSSMKRINHRPYKSALPVGECARCMDCAVTMPFVPCDGCCAHVRARKSELP